jgi:hypothetical protein
VVSAESCRAPIPFASLVEYWLGESAEPAAAQIEEHVFGCAQCTARLQRVADLSDGVRELVRDGVVDAVVTAAFVERLSREGVRVREYRVPRNGSVYCTVAPDDDVLVSRLQAPLADVTRVDLVWAATPDASEQRFADVAFDAALGEVVLLPQIAAVRALPATRKTARLFAVDDSGERLIGEYTFIHTPWPGR